MIISHKHKFIFIKTQKTAGTSIETYLSQFCDENDIVTPFGRPEEGHIPRNWQGFHSHIQAFEVKAILQENIWNNYFKFCFERNPWDKTISHFYFRKYRHAGSAQTFEDYLEQKNFCFNYPKYTDQSGAIIVDRVGKYENLNDELSEILPSLGIPFKMSLNIFAKTGYRQNRKPYQEFYTHEQKNIIQDAFEIELRLFGFQFDRP